jgi:gentisate 1,2-dioxygenase
MVLFEISFGRLVVGASWQDIFVVPSWKPVVHDAPDEAVLFSCSDRPVQEALQLFREDRHSA